MSDKVDEKHMFFTYYGCYGVFRCGGRVNAVGKLFTAKSRRKRRGRLCVWMYPPYL